MLYHRLLLLISCYLMSNIIRYMLAILRGRRDCTRAFDDDATDDVFNFISNRL
jgi:hypothetical protein